MPGPVTSHGVACKDFFNYLQANVENGNTLGLSFSQVSREDPKKGLFSNLLPVQAQNLEDLRRNGQ